MGGPAENVRRDRMHRWFRARWGWVVTAAGFIVNLVTYNMLYCYGILLVTFQQEFSTNTVTAGWVGSVAIGISCLSSPIANPLIELFGNRVVIVIGIILCFSSVILTSFMPVLEAMYFTFSILYGLGAGFQLMSSTNLALQYFPALNSTRSVSIIMSGANIGMLCTGPFLLYLVNNIGWRNSLRVMGAIILGIGLPMTYAYDQPRNILQNINIPEGTMEESAQESAPAEKVQCLPSNKEAIEQKTCTSEMNSREECEPLKCKDTGCHGNEKSTLDGGKRKGQKRNLFWRILVVLTFPDLWLFCIACFGYGACSSFVYVHVVPYCLSLGFTEEKGAQAIMAIGISTLLGKFVLSYFGDRVPFPKIFIFLVATGVGISLSIYLLFISSVIEIFIIITLMGLLVNGICDTLPYSVCNQIFGVERGMETWTLVTCFHGVGYLISSVFGKSVDQTGSYNGAIWATIIIYAVSGLLCVMVPVYQRLFARDRFVMADSFQRCCSRKCGQAKEQIKEKNNDKFGDVSVIVDLPRE
ncbi:monocarboxylate transporter 12-like [Lytechinus pictus]|uniref:monocarboxylate transporter 12-like n=1 Tax=Lytechinus pictus TaxID=7653 RepID=UPI0030BA0BE8